ncbi:hypothetical protein GCM10027456_75950 [Kineosporia babensis]
MRRRAGLSAGACLALVRWREPCQVGVWRVLQAREARLGRLACQGRGLRREVIRPLERVSRVQVRCQGQAAFLG